MKQIELRSTDFEATNKLTTIFGGCFISTDFKKKKQKLIFLLFRLLEKNDLQRFKKKK